MLSRLSLALAVAALVGCEGTKLLPGDVGGPCRQDTDCKPDLSCLIHGFSGICVAEGFFCSGGCPMGLTCATAPGDGAERCWHLPRLAGDLCGDAPAICGPGLSCYGDTPRSCVVTEDYRGRSCQAAWECPPELPCRLGADGGACSDPGTGADVDCSTTPCSAGLVCNQGFAPPRCRPPGAAGEPCFRGAETGVPGSDCGAALVCNWAGSDLPGGGRCAEPGEAGVPCLRDEECATGLSCARDDGGDGRCE